MAFILDPGTIAVCIPLVAMCIPIVAIYTKHRERLAEIQSRARETKTVVGDEALRAEVQQLKDQLMALRETTTKFDLSFDASLDGMEERMKRLEERQLASTYQTTTAEPVARLRAES